ncbi:MAG: glycosyltransferase family 2 protein [Oscillospiraceae bacterium]|nr:glycosyltransferase family 2 protein [Oscillospiraceae bacterium]
MMIYNCTLSIIIPVYNCFEYIYKCTNSILSQENDDVELILVDDGSTDGSYDICDNIANSDPRVKIIHQKNQGVSSARNAGLEAARGKYVTFVDGDDTVSSDYIKVITESINENNADLIIWSIQSIYYKESIKDINHAESNNIYNIFYKNYTEESCYYLINNTNLISGCNKLYKLDVIRENKIIFNVSQSVVEDYTFNVKYMSYTNSVQCISDILYNYYIKSHTNYTSKRRKTNFINDLRIMYDSVVHFFKEKNLPLNLDYLMIYFNIGILNLNEIKDKQIPYNQKSKICNSILKDNVFQMMLEYQRKNAVYDNKYIFVLKRKSFLLLTIFDMLVKLKSSITIKRKKL